ncbi:MAG: transporter substrate-binding domain-containing protein [Micromonosporaceae bacterium]|nr:transporter substrate-binding domain-containing protein [Micromonosporaceae bacterium]
MNSQRPTSSWLATAAALTLALTVAACNGDSDPGDEGAATGPDGEPNPVTIRFTVFPGALASMGVYIADALGHFEEEGVEIEYVTVGTGSSAMAVLLAGETDFTISDITGVATARQAGGEPVFVSAQYHGFGAAVACRPDVQFTTTAYPGSMRELEGKTIGITAPGSATDTYLRYSMIAAGADPGQAEIVPIGGVPQLLSAYTAGSVDCLVAYQPLQHLIEDYQSVVNWETGEGPAEFGDYVFNGIITTESYDSDHSEIVARVQQAMQQTIEFARDPDNAEEIAAATLQFFEGLEEDVLAQIMRDSAETFGYEFTEAHVGNAATVYQAITGNELGITYADLIAPSLR